MILLQAIRLDVYGGFQFRIDTPDGASVLLSNAEEAVRKLSELGVTNSARLVEHVRTWGVVEIRMDGD